MKVCEICGKGIRSGHKISHAHKLSKRKWHPNIQRVKVIMGGTVKRIYVCTKCLKSGKVKKAASRSVSQASSRKPQASSHKPQAASL